MDHLQSESDTAPSLTPEVDLRTYGMGEVAYMRRIHLMGKSLISIHAADGTPLSILDTEDQARAIIAENDIRLVTVQ